MLRGAFLGFGNVAANGHAPGWQARPDVRIVAAVDADPDRQAPFRERFPDAAWYAEPDALLAGQALDFVDICTPPGQHAAQIAWALDAGLHVLCEKPLVTRLDQLEPILSKAKSAGRVVAPVHNWAQAPILRAVAAQLQQGVVGDVRRIEWQTLRTKPAVTVGEDGGDNWRLDPEAAGGGILFDHGWHALYCVCRLMGRPPQAARGRLEQRKYTALALEDTADVELAFDGASARIFLTWAADRRENSLVVEGAEGRLWIDGAALNVENGTGVTTSQHPPSLSEGSHHADWFGGVADAFVEAITAEPAGQDGLAEAALCARLIAAAQESDRTGGGSVSVPDPV